MWIQALIGNKMVVLLFEEKFWLQPCFLAETSVHELSFNFFPFWTLTLAFQKLGIDF